MSSTSFDDVLTCLQDVQDNTKLLKLLIDVRKKIDADCARNKDNINKIRERGSFRKIVASLQTSKKGIVNVSLSILGNCCLDAKCARDVVSQYNILSSLNQLLKRFPKDDSINGRVFRIVGNLCQHTEQWATVIIDKKPQIVIHIVKTLSESANEDDEKVSEATVTMGIRALRELLNRETLDTLVKAHGALKAVGMVLIKYGGVWESTKKGEGVVTNIIKLLHEYSRYRYYPAILEMRNTDLGDSIAYLSKILLIAPRQIVKIIMNFLKISHLKSDLPVPEIFDSFVEVLKDDSLIQEFNSTCEECIKCLCYLFDHPGNRENERCGDSIPILINILKGLTFESNRKTECCLLIISTLNKCRYNNSLIADQIKCNVITVLDDKLKLIVGNVVPMNVNHKSEKRRKTGLYLKFGKRHKKCRLSPENEEKSDELSTSSSDEEIDRFYSGSLRFDHSPASSNESELAMSWTSGLSPQSSPRSHQFEVSESDSDDYSPVCSEADPSEFAFPSMEDEDFTNAELESKNIDDIPEEPNDQTNYYFDLDSSTVKQIKMKLIMEIADLLKTYAKIKPVLPQLGMPELLLKLVKGCGYFDESHSYSIVDVAEVIFRILGSHDYLLPLMQSDFIPTVYGLIELQHGVWCAKCRQFRYIGLCVIKKLSIVAESGGGKGDIAHKLLRGDTVTKQQLVLVIPYIIKNKSILVKLMLNCGGLEILMKLLKNENDFQHNKSIRVLCVLASKKLGIPNPKQVSNTYKANLTEWESNNPLTIVTFKLDDGSCLNADRELLSNCSDFFARLLNGDFKESYQDVITLPNVTNKALTYLLDFMKCDLDKTELIDIDLDLNTHLDVIGLCDRFLMEQYRVYLTDCMEKFKLSSDTVPTIYNWSLESGTNLLRVECIAYALVGNIIEGDRLKMFKNLFELGYTEELVEDIRKLLVRYMTMNQFCDCKKKKGRHCDKNFHRYLLK